MAGIFERMGTIVKGNVNKGLDALEGDGQVVMEQSLRDAKVQFAKQKQATAEIIADENRRKKEVENLQKEVAEAHGWAVAAVKAGDDAKAQKALEIEAEKKSRLETAQAALTQAHQRSEQMKRELDKIQQQINQADTIMRQTVSNNKVAKAAQVSQKGVISDSKLNRFNELAAKSEAKLESAFAYNDLDASLSSSDEDELRAEFGSSSTSDALAALKAEMGVAE